MQPGGPRLDEWFWKYWLASHSSGTPRRLVMRRSLTLPRARSESFERFGSCIAYATVDGFEKLSQEGAMDGDYIFLCGVMWCCYGQEDAGRELLRAADSADPDLSALALAMLRQRGHSLYQHTA
jgi:hypothetical protein